MRRGGRLLAGDEKNQPSLLPFLFSLFHMYHVVSSTMWDSYVPDDLELGIEIVFPDLADLERTK